MDMNRIAVRWNPLEPTEILERKFLDRAVPVAARAEHPPDVRRLPDRPARVPASPETRATLFGAYFQKLARTYPEVTDFIVANEPNEAFFWRPQFGPGKRAGVSRRLPAHDYCRAYDALKAVNPDIRVIAAGLVRGRERPHVDVAGSFPRRAGRRLPQEWLGRAGHGRSRLPRLSAAQHPSSVEPLRVAERGRGRPPSHQAGRLGRVQRHRAADVPEKGLPVDREDLGLVIGEFGWQVDIGPDAGGPVQRQRERPHDHRGRAGRSLLGAGRDARLRSDGDGRAPAPHGRRPRSRPLPVRAAPPRPRERPSYAAVRKAIAAARSCGTLTSWTHAHGSHGREGDLRRARPSRTQGCLRHLDKGRRGGACEGRHVPRQRTRRETRHRRGRALPIPGNARHGRGEDDEELVRAGHKPRLEFRGQVAPGYYVFGLRLTATTNPDRSRTFVSKVFRVG